MSEVNKKDTVVIWMGRFAAFGGIAEGTRNLFNSLIKAGVKYISFDTKLMCVVGHSNARNVNVFEVDNKIWITTNDPGLYFVVIFFDTPEKKARWLARIRVGYIIWIFFVVMGIIFLLTWYLLK